MLLTLIEIPENTNYNTININGISIEYCCGCKNILDFYSEDTYMPKCFYFNNEQLEIIPFDCNMTNKGSFLVKRSKNCLKHFCFIKIE